jgi:drug/metabolite transporter (DMT)-like permease
MTDVIRAILLFYLTPIWGTLLGLIVLGERLTVTRVLALVLGLCGLLVVLGLGQKFPWPKNIGDWLALSSGMFWAYGSMKLYQMEKIAASEQVLAFLFGSLFVSGFILLVGGPELAAKVDIKVVFNAMPYALLLTIYLIPMFYLTIWPATLLAPGRVGVLLMSEIVVGVITAAIISGEPFGIREALGTIMIVSAALLEILGARKIT